MNTNKSGKRQSGNIEIENNEQEERNIDTDKRRGTKGDQTTEDICDIFSSILHFDCDPCCV